LNLRLVVPASAHAMARPRVQKPIRRPSRHHQAGL